MWHTSRGERTLKGHEAELVRHAIDSMLEALVMYVDDEQEQPGPACATGVSVYDCCSVHQRIGLLHEVARHLLTDTQSSPNLSATLEGTIAAIFADIRDQVAIEIELSAELQQEEEADAADASDDEGIDREMIDEEAIYETGQDVDADITGWRRLVLNAYHSLAQSDPPLDLQPSNPDHIGDNRSPTDRGTPDPNDPASNLQQRRRTPPVESLPSVLCDQLSNWEPVINQLTEAILWDRDYEMADSFLDEDPDISRSRRELLGISEDYFTCIAPDPRPEELNDWVDQTRQIVRSKPR